MAIEHSCHVCGHALRQVRAPLDTVYKLPIVVCPSCGTACVRRRHPLSVWWRGFRKFVATALGLGWRTVACIVMVLATLGICSMFSDSLHTLGPVQMWRFVREGGVDETWIESWKLDNGPLIAVVAVAWCIAVGATLTAGFAHIRRRQVLWPLLVAAIMGVLLIDAVLNYADAVSSPAQFGGAPIKLSQYFVTFNQLGGWLLAGLIVSLLGIPIGRALRGPLGKRDARRWIKRLARSRARRLAI